MLAFLALTACLAPESGIDDSHIEGTVTVPARLESEYGFKNDKAADANDFGVLTIGYTVVDGTMDDFATHGDASEGKADVDWLAFTADAAVEGSMIVRLGDATLPAPLPDTGVPVDTDTSVPVDTDTSVPVDTDTAVDTDTFDSAFDSAFDTGAPTFTPPVVRVSVADLSDPAHPVVLGDPIDVDAAGGEVPFAFESGVRYGIRLEGLVGELDTPWLVAVPGVHPDAAGIKVGAYQSADPAALGAPVGGTTPRAFELADDFSFTAPYEVVFIQSFTRDAEDTDLVTVDTDIPEVWLYAATWPNLNAGLRSGTFYSSTPAHLPLSGASLYAADPLVLDAYAEALVGVTYAEQEPNDLDLDLDPYDFTPAETLEGLSPAGYVDTITGSIVWDDDVDTFHLRVASDVFLFGALTWDDASDVDFYVLDATGGIIDSAATYDNPEVGAGVLLAADTDYYLLIIGYASDGVATETPYAMTLEWGAP